MADITAKVRVISGDSRSRPTRAQLLEQLRVVATAPLPTKPVQRVETPIQRRLALSDVPVVTEPPAEMPYVASSRGRRVDPERLLRDWALVRRGR